MYILSSPFTKTFDTLGLLYFVPDFLVDQIKEGVIVEAPIGTKIENIIVLEIIENLEKFSIKNKIKISEEKIRSITSIVTQTQLITKENIELSKFISEYYFTQIHNSINLFFPTIVRKKILDLNEKFFDRLNLKKENNNFINDIKLNILSYKQEDVYNKIQNNFKENNKINLLYGITGSGKTEIYIKLILDNLAKNKQSLLLIPEIILNNQIGEKIIKIFGEENIIIINSSITDGQKAKYFADIYIGKAKIIIGTRSSLFFPYKNLGLIIMDEEHDNSYNSDKSPRYKTKEILEKKLKINPSLNILLASGTPSINSMYKAVKGEWNLINLLEKYKK